MSSYGASKLLRASLVLPEGNFPGTSSNTLVLSNYRMSAQIERAGNYAITCTLRIYGMLQQDMNAVTVLYGQGGNIVQINARAVLILEANDGSGWLQIFEGQFQQAQPDYRSMPDVCLTLQATTGAGQQLLQAGPSSYNGSTQAESIAANLASAMGFAFENNGVSVTLSSPYFAGTLWDQFRDLAAAARFDYYFDANSTLIICQRNKARNNAAAIPVNAQTGMVGYPNIEVYGISVKVLFIPALTLGQPITISGASNPNINGTWFPYHAMDELESVLPDGAWFSTLKCMPHSEQAT